MTYYVEIDHKANGLFDWEIAEVDILGIEGEFNIYLKLVPNNILPWIGIKCLEQLGRSLAEQLDAKLKYISMIVAYGWVMLRFTMEEDSHAS